MENNINGIVRSNDNSKIDYGKLEKFEINKANIGKIIGNIREIIFKEYIKNTKIDDNIIKELLKIILIPIHESKFKTIKDFKNLHELTNFILGLTEDDIENSLEYNQIRKQDFIDLIKEIENFSNEPNITDQIIDLEGEYNQYYNTKK